MGLEKQQRPPLTPPGERLAPVKAFSAASTAVHPRGLISLATTSTGAPTVWTLSRAPKVGETVALFAKTVQSSSAGPLHVNMASGVAVGTSSENMLTLATEGDGALLYAFSSDRYGVVGSFGAAVSTST